MHKLTSKERVGLTLNHKEPDRIPIDLGSTIVTSITKKAYEKLKKFFNLPLQKFQLIDYVQQLPMIGEDILGKFGVDFRPLYAKGPSNWKFEIKDEDNYYTFIDQWGAELWMPKANGLYFDWRKFPIKEATMDELKRYKWPDPDDPARYEGIEQEVKSLYENTNYAIVGSCIFGGGIIEQGARIMPMQEYLMAFANNMKFINVLVEKILELYMRCNEHYLEKVGKYIDVYVYWDDLAGQNGPLISPEVYRKVIKPRQKKMFDGIRKKTKAKIFFHSCGAVYEFIPDLIEIGVDILNPVQLSADGMDPIRLKREFGRDIVFWGGGCDTQHILPNGSIEDVKEEVELRIQQLASGGGFVFNPVHNIQADVPPENIAAAFETVLEKGYY